MDDDSDNEWEAAAICVLAAVAADKRQWPRPKHQRLVHDTESWEVVREHQLYSESWFSANLRCSSRAFDTVCGRVKDRWGDVLPRLGRNATIDISKKVAITMFYLCQGCSVIVAGEMFGVGKTAATNAVQQVTSVLSACADDAIRPPTTTEAWQEIAAGFQAISGFPGAIGAIDGCLIRIMRFADFDGWYCRRGYPAFNLMAVVDHRQRFRAFSLRNGAQNDKSVFNRAAFTRDQLPLAPPGTHLLGDAGYQLLPNVMTPFPILPVMEPANRWYNLVHSRSRITVEQSFGRLKGKFRIYKRDLLQQTPEEMAKVIKSTLVLHNWIIDLDHDALEEITLDDWMEIDRVWWSSDDAAATDPPTTTAHEKRVRIRDFLFARRMAEQSAQVA